MYQNKKVYIFQSVFNALFCPAHFHPRPAPHIPGSKSDISGRILRITCQGISDFAKLSNCFEEHWRLGRNLFSLTAMIIIFGMIINVIKMMMMMLMMMMMMMMMTKKASSAAISPVSRAESFSLESAQASLQPTVIVIIVIMVVVIVVIIIVIVIITIINKSQHLPPSSPLSSSSWSS